MGTRRDKVVSWKRSGFREVLRVAARGLLLPYGPSRHLDPKIYTSNLHFMRTLTLSLTARTLARINANVPWPVHPSSHVTHPDRVRFDPQYAPNFLSARCYWQSIEGIVFRGSFLVAVGATFISQNHDPHDARRHVSAGRPIVIGENAWFGANCTILPGVELGPFTTVAAGAVVNRSFPEGYCILAGVPARVVKKLDPARARAFTAVDLWGPGPAEPRASSEREPG